jgi:hypothetical protein
MSGLSDDATSFYLVDEIDKKQFGIISEGFVPKSRNLN